jgi:RimJ/RimL family protein N-acetyltransferase
VSLILRDLVPTDREDLVLACSDPEIGRWLDRVPQPYTLDDADFFVDHVAEQVRLGRGYVFVGANAPRERLMGLIGLDIDQNARHMGTIGYWAAPWARRKGIANQLCELLIEWAKGSTDIVRFQALVDPANVASRGVVERAGFHCEGLQRSVMAGRGGVLRDMLIYARIEPRPVQSRPGV